MNMRRSPASPLRWHVTVRGPAGAPSGLSPCLSVLGHAYQLRRPHALLVLFTHAIQFCCVAMQSALQIALACTSSTRVRLCSETMQSKLIEGTNNGMRCSQN